MGPGAVAAPRATGQDGHATERIALHVWDIGPDRGEALAMGLGLDAAASLLTAINCRNETAISMPASGTETKSLSAM